jgi:sulfatase modifying factor 1
MNRLLVGCSLAALFYCAGVSFADTFGSGANSFDIDFVTIGNPGNPADTTGVPSTAGSVLYTYRIGKYEISEQMIDKANALGGLGTTKDTRGPNKPATSISWYEAAKFVNWLNTSTGNHAAYKFDIGGNFQLWQPTDPGYMPGILFRNSLAKYFLSSVDEWYKAAYYDPSAGIYYNFPTGSDIPPISVATGTAPGTAVYQAGPADITQAGGLSPYGTMAQGGNAAEWNETSLSATGQSPDLSGRAIRGGDWASFANDLASFSAVQLIPSAESATVGFRVSSNVPEPSIIALFESALVIIFGVRNRCRIARRHYHGR